MMNDVVVNAESLFRELGFIKITDDVDDVIIYQYNGDIPFKDVYGFGITFDIFNKYYYFWHTPDDAFMDYNVPYDLHYAINEQVCELGWD